MRKDFVLISDQLKELNEEISKLKALVAAQSKEIGELKKQVSATTMVNIEENGKVSAESYGNLILDEIISIKKKLEGFTAEGLRAIVNDVAALKNKLEDKAEGGSVAPDFSLSELKAELLKLADMMSV